MNFIELFLISVGLSMDAFAVSVCLGFAMSKATIKKSLIIGLYFGIFQGVMPLIGYFAASLFADKISSYDHWIAFLLLSFLGGKMIFESFKENMQVDFENKEVNLNPSKMIPLAIATSIDAMAVGVSFAFLEDISYDAKPLSSVGKVDIIPSVLFIGVITLIISMVGVKIGKVFGAKLKSKAELIGGLILVLIGIKILFEHLS